MTKGLRRRILAAVVVLMAPLLVTTTVARAATCRGTKVVQNCTSIHADGTPYYTDMSKLGFLECHPAVVPCDYPENIFDLFRLLAPER